MFKKIIVLMLTLALISPMTAKTAEAHYGHGGGVPGWALGLGIVGGLGLGYALARPYYAYPAYDPYAYGNVYTYTPPTVYVQPGYAPQAPVAQQYCREYTQNVVVGGVVQQSYGTACLMQDGQWHIVN
jgi:hypothetical protein